jgi:hypothetical protein
MTRKAKAAAPVGYSATKTQAVKDVAAAHGLPVVGVETQEACDLVSDAVKRALLDLAPQSLRATIAALGTPTITVTPGEYRTRGGDIVCVTDIGASAWGWVDGEERAWTIHTGRVFNGAPGGDRLDLVERVGGSK